MFVEAYVMSWSEILTTTSALMQGLGVVLVLFFVVYAPDPGLSP